MNFKLAIIVIIYLASVSGNKIIESPHITNWGEWGAWQKCPFGRAVQGLQIKTEPYQGLLEDDTVVNAIRLYCGDPSNATTTFITSTEASWGQWGNIYSCRSDNRPLPPDGYVTGFQLRVEAPHAGDDTATNNVRIFCSYTDGTAEQQREADGLTYGSWTAAQRCDSNQVVCAIQTQVEKYQGDSDDTALNNVAVECCDR